MNLAKLLCVCLASALSHQAAAQAALGALPAHIDRGAAYVFYSHGQIVEGGSETPVHPRWGMYDFPGIKAALSEGHRFQLIAHHRPSGSGLERSAAQLVAWVRRLIAAGVPPQRITLVGFSRGGVITALASSRLKPLPINTALLATCWAGSVQDQANVTLAGRLLSIYETSDHAASCRALAERSPIVSFREISISTGKEHGAFYQPLPDWVNPLLAWIG